MSRLPVATFGALVLATVAAFFVTQHLNTITGGSTQYGVTLMQNSNVPGSSSPNNVYLKSNATPEGLYTFGGSAANSQFAYLIAVPEPTSLTLFGLIGAAGFGWRRMRSKKS